MLVVWKRLDNTYYARQVRGTYGSYEIGFKNQYGHEVVLVVDLQNSNDLPLWKKYIDCRRYFLNRLEKFFEERR